MRACVRACVRARSWSRETTIFPRRWRAGCSRPFRGRLLVDASLDAYDTSEYTLLAICLISQAKTGLSALAVLRKPLTSTELATSLTRLFRHS